MVLEFNYGKILGIAKECRKKGLKVGQLVEVVQYIFTDEEVLHIFVRVGGNLGKNEDAINAIGEEMANGVDYFEIQQNVLRALIEANFYKKELQEMLNSLTETEKEKK